MTSGIVMLGAQPRVVNGKPGEANGYAPASGRTGRISSRVTPSGKVASHLAQLLT
jgi:hypothetical protein